MGPRLTAIIASIFPLLASSSFTALKSYMSGTALRGKTYLVTGSTDGIGQHTAMKLAENGATVLLHGRDRRRLDTTKSLILKANPDAILKEYLYDLETIDATKQFAEHILSSNDRLDGLINNAGVYRETLKKTSDDLEATFAINVAAPFILTCLLLPLLRRTPQSKILNVSSISQGGSIDVENLQFEKRSYSSHSAYSLSKLYMAAFSHELATRVTAEEALVLSCDPGTVNTKMLLAGWGYCGIDIDDANDEFNLITADFNPTVHGTYFVSCHPSRCHRDVYNDALRSALWNRLEEITGVSLPVSTL
jgi:NAD(P)-dependent dehydrogenase (short-subunit alcohol dehydrogenase family)